MKWNCFRKNFTIKMYHVVMSGFVSNFISTRIKEKSFRNKISEICHLLPWKEAKLFVQLLWQFAYKEKGKSSLIHVEFTF